MSKDPSPNPEKRQSEAARHEVSRHEVSRHEVSRQEVPRHQESGEDYPLEWAHRVELAMDEGQARALVYGGLFGAFVLVVVTIGLVCVLADTPPF